jgi:hypothetical protein
MKKLLPAVIILLLIPATLFAWDNPNKAAAPQRQVAADKAFQITLETRSVQHVNGDTFTYDTGRGIITIKSDSFRARQFVKEVQSGRKSATARVTLTPQRKSPFNTEYKAR